MNLEAYKTVTKNKANQFLITLPQWPKITDYKLWSDENLPPCLFTSICAETHEDGGNHHHIVIHTKTKIPRLSLLSRFKQLFPDAFARIDIAQIKKNSIQHCIDYINKEDPFVWKHGVIPIGGRPQKALNKPIEALTVIYNELMEEAKMKKFVKHCEEKKALFEYRWNEFAKFAKLVKDVEVKTNNTGDFNWFRSFYEDDDWLGEPIRY